MFKLYKHQKEQNKAVRQALKTYNHILYGATTGFGKSACIWDFVKKNIDDKKILVLAPRKTLVEQLTSTLDEFKPFMVLNSRRVGNFKSNLVVSSKQTMNRQLKNGNPTFDNFDIIMIDECFTGDTEVLTEDGFYRFDELPKNVKVAQFESKNKKIDYIEPIRYVKKHFEGNLVKIQGKDSLDIYCTPNHDILQYKKDDGSYRKIKAKDVKKSTHYKIPTAGYINKRGDGELSDNEKLAIAFQADGSIHNRYVQNPQNCDALESRWGKKSFYGESSLTFSFSKEKKIKQFIKDFSKLNMREVKGHNGKRRFMLYDIKNESISKNLNDVFDVKKLSYDKIKNIIEYMMIWDGHVHKINSDLLHYSSTLEDNVDFLQRLCISVGYHTKKTKVVDNRSENYSDIYRLHISKHINKKTTHEPVCDKTTYHNGYVYCVTVPTGNIIIRRNGKPAVVGNCHLGGAFPPKPNTEFHMLYEKYWNKAQWIGFSATPITPKGYRLEGWDATIYKYQTADLIGMGALADYDYYAPEQIDLSKLKVNNMGEYTADDVEGITNMPTSIDSVKEQWLKYKDERKILIFASSINHAKLLHKELDGCGIVHSKQSDFEQKKILTQFRSGEITTVINVGILTTGFDDPTVDCLIIARPIRSELLAIQVWGRALRLSKGQRKKAIILDMCNVWENCGLPKDIRDFNKVYKPREKVERNDEKIDPTKTCPFCKEVFHVSEMKVKKKTKKRFIITRKKCPICKEVIEENRADLVEIERLQKIEEAKTRVYTNNERYKIIGDLIEEHTGAKRSWGKFILRSILDTGREQLLDQAINKGTSTRTLWKKVMDMKTASDVELN